VTESACTLAVSSGVAPWKSHKALTIETLSRIGAAAFTQNLSSELRMPPSREARLISIR